MAKIDGGFIRVSSGHPVVHAFMAHAAKRKAHPRLLGRKVIEDWCIAHGQQVERKRAKKLRAPERALSPDGVLDIWANVSLLDCMRELSQRLRMPVATLGVAAMAWHLGLGPCEHKPSNGVVVVLPPRAWPGAPDDDVHVPAWDRTQKFVRNRHAGTTERKLKLESFASMDPSHVRRETPALLAFEAARRSASEMGHPPPRSRRMRDDLAPLVVWLPDRPESKPQEKPTQAAVRAPRVDVGSVVCRFCEKRPVASAEAKRDHGACVTCWSASLNHRIANRLTPRASIGPRVAWLREVHGVTARQAAVLSGMARTAEGRAAR